MARRAIPIFGGILDGDYSTIGGVPGDRHQFRNETQFTWYELYAPVGHEPVWIADGMVPALVRHGIRPSQKRAS